MQAVRPLPVETWKGPALHSLLSSPPDVVKTGLLAGAEQVIEAAELRRLVDDFVSALDERERLVFDARFREQQSVRAAVEQTGLSDMKVRYTEKKLKARLLEHLRAHGYLGGDGAGPAGGSVTALLLLVGIVLPAMEIVAERGGPS